MRTVLLTISALLVTACNGADNQDGAAGTQGSNENLADASGSMGADAEAPITSEAYVERAAMSDMFEIQSGQLAIEQAGSDETREFARMMVADHTKSSQDLRAAVSQTGTTIAIPAQLDAEHQTMLDTLTGLQKSDFDQEYMSQQMAAHAKALALHQSYSGKGDQAALRDFAQKVLPVIQKHHEQSERNAGTNGTASNGSGMKTSSPEGYEGGTSSTD